MQPVSPVIPNHSFTEVVYAKGQPQYKPLPAIKYDDGHILTRWKLSWKERLKIFFSGNLYLWVSTFNQPLQPLLMQVDRPKLEN